MPARGPGLGTLPDRFPVFPLSGALLLPHARMPLNIFEARYLAMTEDALATSRHIGMIQPHAGRGPGANGPVLHRVGCLGRVVAFAETEDGRYLITLEGVIRFAVAEELEMTRGYRRVRGDYADFARDLGPPDDGGDAPGFDRPALIDALHGYFALHQIEVNWTAVDALENASLVTTLAMACPFPPLEKQALIEAPTDADRAATLLALLRIDMHAPARDNSDQRPS